jgi:hypothetical protein
VRSGKLGDGKAIMPASMKLCPPPAAEYDPLASAQAIADLIARLRMVRTPCTDPFELRAQKWFVESFLDCEFHIKRHQAANCAMQVYGLDHRRSRDLFDLTLVAIRRELIVDRRLSRFNASGLQAPELTQ